MCEYIVCECECVNCVCESSYVVRVREMCLSQFGEVIKLTDIFVQCFSHISKQYVFFCNMRERQVPNSSMSSIMKGKCLTLACYAS